MKAFSTLGAVYYVACLWHVKIDMYFNGVGEFQREPRFIISSILQFCNSYLLVFFLFLRCRV